MYLYLIKVKSKLVCLEHSLIDYHTHGDAQFFKCCLIILIYRGKSQRVGKFQVVEREVQGGGGAGRGTWERWPQPTFSLEFKGTGQGVCSQIDSFWQLWLASEGTPGAFVVSFYAPAPASMNSLSLSRSNCTFNGF